MNAIKSPLIDAATLAKHLETVDAATPAPLLCDVRFDLAAPEAGRAAYRQGHLPGAVYLHLDEDLSAAKTGRNGRHPLPDRATFARTMAQLGATPQTQIVAYDAQGGMFAARLWWMLRWIGHSQVVVLDGGMQAWQASGLLLDDTTPPPRQGHLPLREPLVESIDANTVLDNLRSCDRLLLDARAPDRYRGENETLDPVGGHIPGALNRFFKDNLGADGRFLPATTLRQQFDALLGTRPANEIVHQCGSGVTACHNLLAMEIAGLSGATLYSGSWSEWCADPARPVAIGPHP